MTYESAEMMVRSISSMMHHIDGTAQMGGVEINWAALKISRATMAPHEAAHFARRSVIEFTAMKRRSVQAFPPNLDVGAA